MQLCNYDFTVKHSILMSYEKPEDVLNGQLNETCYCPKDCSEIIYFPDVSYVQMYYYLERYHSIKYH